MWSKWELIDCDCCQFMRTDGENYEMIQAVWLDTTPEDIDNGYHEYCIVRGSVNPSKDFTQEEIETYMIPYSFNETPDEFTIAECILETDLISDSYAIGDADSFDEAKRIVDNIINKDR